MDQRRFDTDVVQAGERVDPNTGALTTPVVRSAPFVFATLADFDDYTSGRHKTWEYSRTAHPTGAVVEAKLAALEGADDCVLLASGMAAVTCCYLALLNAGDHVLVTDDGYKRTLYMARDILPRWGIQSGWIDSLDPVTALRAALRPNTKLVVAEVPSNPHLRVADITALAQVCHAGGALLAIDATLASPINLRPLELGADLVIHSLTKYGGGHNDLLAGSIAGRQELIDRIREFHVNMGAVLDPDACYLLLRGLKTLALRVERQNATALACAEHLAAQPDVRCVHYCGLPSHPHHELARRQLRGCGGLLSFELETDLAGVGRFIDALEVIRLGTSLGGVESLCLHMSTLVKYGISDAERLALGYCDELVRLSVGLEDPLDLLADLDRGLAAMRRG